MTLLSPSCKCIAVLQLSHSPINAVSILKTSAHIMSSRIDFLDGITGEEIL